MNADVFEGKWKEIKGDLKVKWGKLTDSDVTEIEGHEDKLLGVLQKRYGYSKDEAEKQYDEFMRRFERPSREKAKKETLH